MRFSLYTEMTVKQAVKAARERMEQKATKTRSAIEGTVTDEGALVWAVDRKVWRSFHRTTRLRATIWRESGLTHIEGSVPDGVGRDGMALIMGGVVLLALVLFAQGDLIFALMVLGIGVVMGSQIWGDHLNHDVLLVELERTLKAKVYNPPKDVKAPKK